MLSRSSSSALQFIQSFGARSEDDADCLFSNDEIEIPSDFPTGSSALIFFFTQVLGLGVLRGPVSFFFHDVHPVVRFAGFRSNAAAVVTPDCSFTHGAPVSKEAYPCVNGLWGMSVFFLLLLLFLLTKSCAIEVNLLVSADPLSVDHHRT
jgi:hypothetical protein